MTLLVNILDEEYERLKRSNFHTVIEECVRNGTPLEQIRAEIEAYDDKLKLCKASPSIEYIMQIIDKHLKAVEE